MHHRRQLRRAEARIDRGGQTGSDDVALDEHETLVIGEVGDVLGGAGAEVVDADDVVAAPDQEVAQVRAEESGAPGDQDVPFAHDRPTPS